MCRIAHVDGSMSSGLLINGYVVFPCKSHSRGVIRFSHGVRGFGVRDMHIDHRLGLAFVRFDDESFVMEATGRPTTVMLVGIVKEARMFRLATCMVVIGGHDSSTGILSAICDSMFDCNVGGFVAVDPKAKQVYGIAHEPTDDVNVGIVPVMDVLATVNELRS